MITAIIDAGQHYCQAVSDLWQWDYGQTLRIQGVKLPAAVEIQFSTTERIGETVTRIGVTKEEVTEVPIPDTLLEGNGASHDYVIYAFIYVEDAISGKTEHKIAMNVRARPKPEAHATAEEGELFRQAIVAVAESADRAESARKSAETASDQAEDAKNAAEAAVGSAQASADEAKTAKANAKTAVKNAEAFKTEAETARSEAVRAVTESTDAKDSAEKSRAAAEKAKQDAEAAKEEIQESADQIQKNATEIDSLKEDIDNIIYKGLINGFDKDNTVGGYLSNNGNVNSNPGFVTSDYFDVHENKTYYALQMVGTVKYDTVAYICFYDSSKAFIAGGYFNASSCTSPNGSKYARVSFPSDETTKARCMFTNIETPDKYYPFGYEYSIITKDVSELKTRKSENRLHGKTMAILGDSMAKGHTLNEKQTWAYKIANRNGMTYQKLAVNGMFITTGHGDADANCLLEQAKKINNNPDIIVIHMGTNDRNNNVELGTWTIRNTDTTNLFGALRVAFTYLEENFPLAQVMFITPYYYQEQTDYIGSIEKACMYVGCHCKNNKQGGICAWNTNVRNALFLDYVHLNEVGQERVSYEYEGFMRTFM